MDLFPHEFFESDSDIDDYDWNELSKEQKKAAETLGYTKKVCTGNVLSYTTWLWTFFYTGLFRFDWQIWDRGGKAPTEDLDWDELSKEQQEAAKVLGYNKEKWDSDD